MKTLLNINGETYLLPPTADPAIVLKHLAGAVRLSYEINYGPENDRYGAAYLSAHVKGLRATTVGVELVDDSAVLSAEEWAAKTDELNKSLPKAA